MPRTTRGRVVYNRKIHLFKPRDVIRIIAKVDWTRGEPGKMLEEAAAIGVILFDAIAALAGRLVWDTEHTLIDTYKGLIKTGWSAFVSVAKAAGFSILILLGLTKK